MIRLLLFLTAAVLVAASLASCTQPPPRPAHSVINAFGGTAYLGQPKLQLTSALLAAGGGPGNFSFNRALESMLGPEQARLEIARLEKQYGPRRVQEFLIGMDYALTRGAKLLAHSGQALPQASKDDFADQALARALVEIGLADDGVFWSGRLFDTLMSHQLHNTMMLNMDVDLSAALDTDSHRVLNQMMYDIAQLLKMHAVRLAPLH